MRYLKYYKIFESTSIPTLKELENYLLSLEYDFTDRIDGDSVIEYNGDNYIIGSRFGVNMTFDLYKDDKIIYQDVGILQRIKNKLTSDNIKLIRTIRFFINNDSDNIYLLNRELIERVKEFDVIKNGKIDFISLNNLFDFYGVEFNEYKFIKYLEKDITRLNENLSSLNLKMKENLINNMCVYFDNQEFNLELHKKYKGFTNIIYYNYVFDIMISGETSMMRQVVGDQKYALGASHSIKSIDDLNTILSLLNKRNNALMNTIGHKLYGPNFYLDMNETLIIEVLDRMKEFDVVKNHKLDEISLNSLFDFYDIEFNLSEFMSHYKYRLTF